MRDSFVFYRSFWEMFELLDSPEEWQELLRAVCAYCLDGIQPEFENNELKRSFIHFQVSCDNAARRYEKAVKDGKKGGRPSKQEYIPPDIWIPVLLEQGNVSKAAAEFGIATRTLYYWIAKSSDSRLDQFKAVQKCKNLSVSVSASDSVSDARYNNYNTPTAPDAADPTGPRQGGGKELNSAQIEYVTQILQAGKPATPEQLEQLSNLGNGGEAVGDV